MLKSSVPKSSNNYTCELCEYNTSRLSQYKRHIATDKHKNQQSATFYQQISTEKSSNMFECICGKIYKERTGLWRHKKVCNSEDMINKTKDNKTDDMTDKELIALLIKEHTKLVEQNSEMLEIIKNGTHYTTNTNCNNNNSNNKTFNLQFFLNETCKDAMNIMDFVDSIKLQLTDLIKVGDIGYVEGISNIITTNLKALDVTQRPIHCTDKKREVLYIKDEDKWEKEDTEKKKIRKLIKRVADKNSRLLPKYKEAHPDCSKSSSNFSDQYNKIIIEAMGGAGDNEIEKEDKIIKNISKNVTIDKVES
jgi:hypothetical protein